MRFKTFVPRQTVLTVVFLLVATHVNAQTPVLPAGDPEPLLRLEAGGPTSFVTALAFNADGKILYAAGWDKVVRTWTLNGRGEFVLDRAVYRVPVGPGNQGAINAMALSEDGNWLAVGGEGVFRQGSTFRRHGWVLPAAGGLTEDMLKDTGTIYLFNTRNQSTRVLRGHRGAVLALAFAPNLAGKPQLLVSAARELDSKSATFSGVLRMWNVDQGKFVDGEAGLTDSTVRPSISIRHTGNQPNQLQVAVAWDDGRFRLWDAERGTAPHWQVADDERNLTVAALPERSQFLTATYGIGKARLRIWNVFPDRAPEAATTERAPAGQANCVPRALSLVSSAANGSPSHAAVVLLMPKGPQEAEYRLQLLALDENNLGVLAGEEQLWFGTLKQPVVATAPRGGHIAVAGNSSHEIWVYNVADMIAHRGQPQRLRGIGKSHQAAAFARKGNDIGILLSQGTSHVPGRNPGQPESGDLIFDIAKRALTNDWEHWKTVSPAMGEWRAELSGQNQSTVLIYKGDRQVARVVDDRVQSFALLPPGPPFQTPILAVASGISGPPLLRLYDAESGEQFRQLTAHTDPIHSLAFSDDGRFMVSAAEDQTVCVWTLTNMGKILRRHGQLTGVAVTAVDGKLTIVRLAADSPAQSQLSEGEVIEGLVEGATSRALASPRDFYESIALIQPGKTATLRVLGAKGQRNVALTVGQGIDERKPLFSLFVTSAGKPGEWDWIGWNPIGPYDSSGLTVEHHLGWHFNTGDAAAPTRFALAKQYHNRYYRKGILQELLAQGDLQQVPPPPPPPRLKMGLLIDDAGTFPDPDGEGVFRVRHPEVTTKLEIVSGSLQGLKAITWNLDGGSENTIDPRKEAGPELTIPLKLQRGVHKLQVLARALEQGSTDVTEELVLRYQPPAPEIHYQGPADLIVKDAAFTLKALIGSALPGEGVAISVSHQNKGSVLSEETTLSALEPNKPLLLNKAFRLQPGNNAFAITAVNQGALPGQKEAETSRLEIQVTLVQKARPPLINLDAFRAVGQPSKTPLELGKPILVAVPRIVLLGTITAGADEKLTEARWIAAQSAAPESLAGFEPGQTRTLDISQEFHLKPGTQVVRVLAKTADSDEAERTLTIEYQPRLPSLAVIAPAPGQVIFGEAETGKLGLQGRLSLPEDRQPYRARVLVDGRESQLSPVIDEQAGTLTADVPIRPGKAGQRLQVRLSNTWGAVTTADAGTVSYLRPPRDLHVETDPKSTKPFIDLILRARSPLPLLASSLKVEVNGRTALPAAVEKIGLPESPLQSLRLTKVPIDPDKNVVRVWVSNLESECLEPAAAGVSYQAVRRPPAVEFLDPLQNAVVSRPDLKARFQIRSESKLRQVRLLGERTAPVPIDVSAQTDDGKSLYELTKDVDLRLEPGFNHLRVEAESDSGRQEARLVVNYAYKPVRTIIDSLAPRKAAGEPLQARSLPGGKFEFAEVPEGLGLLQGHVLWDEADDTRLQKAATVQVYVNGFQQRPAILEPAEAGVRQRNFKAEILLGRSADNHIAIALPELEQDACSCTQLSMQCKNPEKSQRLHLVAVSLVEKDGERVKAQLLQALKCTTGAKGLPEMSAFDSVEILEPRTGYNVIRPSVLLQLHSIRAKINGLAKAGAPASDVVVFYYQGGEAVNTQGNFYLTGNSAVGNGADPASLSGDELVAFFSQTPGAHILLFDVGRNTLPDEGARDKIAKWEESYGDIKLNISVLRYAWLGQAKEPAQLHLIDGLKEAMPRATRLAEITDRVREFAAGSPSYQKSLVYDQWLSGDMKEILFNKQR
jgi:WD40 repeat protein